MVILHRSTNLGFHLAFFCDLVVVLLRLMVVVVLLRNVTCVVLIQRFDFSSSSYDIYLCMSDSNRQNISNQRQQIKSMVVSMLQN